MSIFNAPQSEFSSIPQLTWNGLKIGNLMEKDGAWQEGKKI
jgi:hypothetical protein